MRDPYRLDRLHHKARATCRLTRYACRSFEKTLPDPPHFVLTDPDDTETSI